jgi:hypothetical protein
MEDEVVQTNFEWLCLAYTGLEDTAQGWRIAKRGVQTTSRQGEFWLLIAAAS